MAVAGHSSQKGQSNIKVAIRIRPILKFEVDRGLEYAHNHLNVLDATQIQVNHDKQIQQGSTGKQYKFDQVFDEDIPQEKVYRRMRIDYLLRQVCNGFHATILVYGQTGSGKTFTMEGYQYAKDKGSIKPVIVASEENDGLIPRAIQDLFALVNAKREREPSNKITITIQYIQLYNEKIYDLLNSNTQKQLRQNFQTIPGLKLKMNPYTDEPHIENLFVFEVSDADEALRFFWKGLKNKVMSSHSLNNASSRSHCIMTLTVYQQDIEHPEGQLISKLQLVDLAGSERQSHTQASNSKPNSQTLLKEAIEINKSLFTLRQVIQALTENTQKQKALATKTANGFQTSGNINTSYIPYRESKLTTLLRQSLGGNSYCLMVACLAPIETYKDENMSTLQYAANASCISNVPRVNMDPRQVLINNQKKQIQTLTSELKRANEQIKFLTQGSCYNCGYNPVNGTIMSEDPYRQYANVQQRNRNQLLPQGSQSLNRNQVYSLTDNEILNQSVSSQGGQSFPQHGKSSPDVRRSVKNSIKQSPSHSQPLKAQQSPSDLPPLKQSLTNSNIMGMQQQSQYAQSEHRYSLKQQQSLQGNNTQNLDAARFNIQNNSPGGIQLSESNFQALKQSQRIKAGLDTQNQFNPGGAGPSTDPKADQLIASISMVKDVLQSNMSLRDQLLNIQNEHERVLQRNFQFNIENEDLRDRLQLLGENTGNVIEYQPYIANGSLEQLIEGIQSKTDLETAKAEIFKYMFSLQKDNRQLKKQIRVNDTRTVRSEFQETGFTNNEPERTRSKVKMSDDNNNYYGTNSNYVDQPIQKTKSQKIQGQASNEYTLHKQNTHQLQNSHLLGGSDSDYPYNSGSQSQAEAVMIMKSSITGGMNPGNYTYSDEPDLKPVRIIKRKNRSKVNQSTNLGMYTKKNLEDEVQLTPAQTGGAQFRTNSQLAKSNNIGPNSSVNSKKLIPIAETDTDDVQMTIQQNGKLYPSATKNSNNYSNSKR